MLTARLLKSENCLPNRDQNCDRIENKHRLAKKISPNSIY